MSKVLQLERRKARKISENSKGVDVWVERGKREKMPRMMHKHLVIHVAFRFVYAKSHNIIDFSMKNCFVVISKKRDLRKC